MPEQALNREIADIRTWLIERVAEYTQREIDDVDPAVKLTRYRFDSIYALSLCGDIEDKYGIEVDPTLVWDYPTIDAIAQYLAGNLA